MKTSPLQLLRQNRDYAILIFASFLSGLGSTYTGLAVYYYLSQINAPAFIYTIAFALSVAPGLITSYFSRRLLSSFSPVKWMIFLELLGALVIALLVIAVTKNHIIFLMLALVLGSFSFGILIPYIDTYVKLRFENKSFLAVAEISNFSFIANFFLGTLTGTLLIGLVGPTSFLIFDVFTYLVSAFLIYWIAKHYPKPFQMAGETLHSGVRFRWKNLTQRQKTAFLMYPMLVIACTPCTAILPAIADQFSPVISVGIFSLNTALILLFAKTNGQMVGPSLVRKLRLDEVSNLFGLAVTCLLLFLGLYWFAFQTHHLMFCLIAVFFAHIFSNIVFAISFVEFKQNFSETEIGAASVSQYQLALVMMVISSVFSGWLVKFFSIQIAVALGLVPLIMLVALHTASKEKENA